MTTPKVPTTPKKPKSLEATISLTALNVFRYLATILLGAGKLGMLGAVPAANLAHTSWFMVLLPSFFLELGVVSLFVIIGLLALAALLLYVLWLAIVQVVVYVKYHWRPARDPWDGTRARPDARERVRQAVRNRDPVLDKLMNDLMGKKPKNE